MDRKYIKFARLAKKTTEQNIVQKVIIYQMKANFILIIMMVVVQISVNVYLIYRMG